MPQNFLACDREQELLLPPSLREWLAEDHFAWFVIDAVGEIDLAAFLAAYRADGHGRAAHDPAMMVALIVYAYAIGERSSRRIGLPSIFRGMEEASTNLELKASDATCNPYLAVGGVIAAGLDGLERGLEPPAPVEVDPATLDADERDALAIRRLPATQAEALDALESDAVLTGALGPVLARSYLAVRRSEWETYSVEDEAFEQQGHFLKY
jgi:glutamine synthetase